MLEHPLTQLAARRLVWAALAEDGRTIHATFRVAEDGSLAGPEDEPFALDLADEDALVSIPHPLRIPASLRARWSEVLGDYEILQPFPQIGRELFAKPEDAGGHDLPGLPEREIPYGVVTGALESRGWKRGVGNGEGMSDSYEKRVAGHVVSLMYSPPSFFREAPPEKVTIETVRFDRAIGSVDEVAFSEIARDLAVFGAGASR
jgi:hypothetical protein